MTSVKVQELLACRERLGITDLLSPDGDSSFAKRVFIYPRCWEKDTPPSFPRTIVILPPAHLRGGMLEDSSKDNLSISHRSIACAVISETSNLPDHIFNFSKRTGIPVFASHYDASLLRSRLIALLREKGERMVLVHGVLVQVSGLGVLLTGESGVGKTACGLDLVGRGNFWVADDAVVLQGRGRILYGRGHERTRKLIALRGQGLLEAEALLGAANICKGSRVDVVIHFVRESGKEAIDRQGRIREIVGVPVPCRCLLADGGPSQMAGRVMDVVREFLTS